MDVTKANIRIARPVVRQVVGVDGPILPGQKQIEEQAVKQFNRVVDAAAEKTFKSDRVPACWGGQYAELINLLRPMIGQSPKEQIDHITAVYWKPDRPGGDCDAGGTWQPVFLDHMARIIAKEAGIDPKEIGAGIKRGEPPASKWRMRKFLDGD